MVNLFTVDVEDWYQAIETIPYSQWNTFESRIERNVGQLLKMLDAYKTKATFFVLGFEAERHPAMVKRIYECGHEIATHGYSHRFIYRLNKEEFRSELKLCQCSVLKKNPMQAWFHNKPGLSLEGLTPS
jgi:hypothetical protein